MRRRRARGGRPARPASGLSPSAPRRSPRPQRGRRVVVDRPLASRDLLEHDAVDVARPLDGHQVRLDVLAHELQVPLVRMAVATAAVRMADDALTRAELYGGDEVSRLDAAVGTLQQ